jgi:Tfp pilus assembly protein PilZ
VRLGCTQAAQWFADAQHRSDEEAQMTTSSASDSTPGGNGTQLHPRLSIALRVRLSTIDAETDPWTGKPFFRSSEETCANVSLGGAFVATKETIPTGRRLLLEFELPGGREVQLTARVAWTTSSLSSSPAGTNGEPGIGVEFIGAPRDQLIELERFVARSFRRRRRLASEQRATFVNTRRP